MSIVTYRVGNKNLKKLVLLGKKMCLRKKIIMKVTDNEQSAGSAWLLHK